MFADKLEKVFAERIAMITNLYFLSLIQQIDFYEASEKTISPIID